MGSKPIVLCALLAWAGSALAAVNANTAPVDELMTVRGIGPSIAQRIVEERRKGPFASLDDLQARVRGVGEASVRRMASRGLVVGAAGAADVAARARPEIHEGGGRARPGHTGRAQSEPRVRRARDPRPPRTGGSAR